MVDLHVHLLPGIDDGPATLVESLAYAWRMSRDGVREAVVTPHVGHPDFPVRPEEIARRADSLRRALAESGIGLRIRPGGEIHAGAVDSMPSDELDLLAQGPPGARWVLLEAPFTAIDGAFARSCERIRSLGMGVLVAHPERSAEGLEHLRPAMVAGALLQVDACSLLGRHGPQARRIAERMLLDGSAYVLASDGHGASRNHTLRAGRDAAVAAGVSVTRAAQLTRANPRFLLEHGLPGTARGDAAATSWWPSSTRS